jgi:hypothetical protein
MKHTGIKVYILKKKINETHGLPTSYYPHAVLDFYLL